MKLDDSFGTKAIHAGNVKEQAYGALTMPIYQTSTFCFESCEQGGRRFAGEEKGYIYTRLGNPTSTVLEDKIAALEGGEAAAVTASGMGAISAVFWTVAAAGKHIIADNTLYGCTFALLEHGLTKFGVDVSFVDTSDIEQVKEALRENTVAVFLETPANPTLKIVDLKKVAMTAHQYNKEIKVICDNTFATPYLQTPLSLGCDIVVHSVTKYINGHGDVIAGCVVADCAFISQLKLFGIKDMTGAVLGPFESFLILRGLKTLEIRMEKHTKSAQKIAEYLEKHPKVEKVYYPGLKNHKNHEIAKEQMNGFGGVVAFEIKGGKKAGIDFVEQLKLCTLAVSLGDVETLIEHPASMTHSTYTKEELAKSGIPESLVRLSVGLEDENDIEADLKQAFENI